MSTFLRILAIYDLGNMDQFTSHIYYNAIQSILYLVTLWNEAQYEQLTDISLVHKELVLFKFNMYIIADKSQLVCVRSLLKCVPPNWYLLLHTSECKTVCECQPIQYVYSVKYLGILKAISPNLGTYRMCVIESEVLRVYCISLKCAFKCRLTASLCTLSV